jgi:hypothetical protein
MELSLECFPDLRRIRLIPLKIQFYQVFYQIAGQKAIKRLSHKKIALPFFYGTIFLWH